MKGQPNRRVADAGKPFAGTAIDRSRPLQFRLDGRTIQGFAGDTVLSAVLASGIDTVGLRHDTPLALSARYAPTIIPATLARDHQRALPMERTPATNGADYVTLAGSKRRSITGWLRRLTGGARRSLDIDLDQPHGMRIPWLNSAGASEEPVDLIVVGGGVAGMTAAVAGAKAGLKVTLLEASPRLGGHARLFGTLEGEETPEQSITRLTTAIGQSDAITVMTHAEVFAVRSNAVRAHVVDLKSGAPTPVVVDLRARHIVIATGTIERLPIFPGNRQPGVVGALEAFDLAYHYGVWPGQSALFTTVSSPAYRLAMLASDAGITIPRIIDGRTQPQSRFIEFSKAYGITLAAGTIVAAVRPAPKGGALVVTPQLAVGTLTRTEADIAVDRLIACGGWQPDLALWHMAGGESRWNQVTARLEPTETGPAGVVLAGSAAGYISRHACLGSGADAVDLLLDRTRIPVQELTIDPIYETPDDPVPVASADHAPGAPTFLDASRRYIERPVEQESRWPAWLPFRPKPAGRSLADTPQPLDVGDIAAGVQLGAIPAASAGIVAQERVAMVAIAAPEAAIEPAPGPLPLIPDYLIGRFGSTAQAWIIAPSESRTLEPGALIQRNADETDPLTAIGIVLRVRDGATIALISAANAGPTAAVREQGRATTVRLVSVYEGG
ncbi:FAD-dependent oxidoreductase [Devosia sp. SL43]|uniref:FAD-dependent oxidoreductase n=1 Tax=Devosia sp. SL43 TaxID=2806348 RepID=UPI001F2B73BC|nr:FAD-dependent oxidoreductase [Devosia sp. SL43]UJW85532.1 FAD-dependent oxidoreductase [Devosia sp. SL43]